VKLTARVKVQTTK